MQRSTPLATAHRSYTGGGARAMIDEINDKTHMQESNNAQGMKGESWPTMESPQNYGFTSVVMPADKDKDGQITDCAEGFVSFMGGNRNFPVMGVMDDRRHRLREMDPGDTAMYRTKDDKQQFHLTKDGGFWSAPEDKTVRMQLVKKDQQQQSQQAGQADGQNGQQQGQKEKGQKPVRKDSTHRFVDVTKDYTTMGGTNTIMRLDDGKGYVHASSDKKVWVGAEKGKATFARLLTENGPSVNSYGNLGSGSLLLGPDGNPLPRYPIPPDQIPPITPEVPPEVEYPPPVIPDRCFYTETSWFDAHVADFNAHVASDAWSDFAGNPGASAPPHYAYPGVPIYQSFKFMRSEGVGATPGVAFGKGMLGLNTADKKLFWRDAIGALQAANLGDIASVPGLLSLMQFVRVSPIQWSGDYTFDPRTHHALIILWGGSGAYNPNIVGGTAPAGGATSFLGLQAGGGTGNHVSGSEGDPSLPGNDGSGSGGIIIVGGGPSGGGPSASGAGRGGLCIQFVSVTPGSTAFLTVGDGGVGGGGMVAGNPGGALIFEMT